MLHAVLCVGYLLLVYHSSLVFNRLHIKQIAWFLLLHANLLVIWTFVLHSNVTSTHVTLKFAREICGKDSHSMKRRSKWQKSSMELTRKKHSEEKNNGWSFSLLPQSLPLASFPYWQSVWLRFLYQNLPLYL